MLLAQSLASHKPAPTGPCTLPTTCSHFFFHCSPKNFPWSRVSIQFSDLTWNLLKRMRCEGFLWLPFRDHQALWKSQTWNRHRETRVQTIKIVLELQLLSKELALNYPRRTLIQSKVRIHYHLLEVSDQEIKRVSELFDFAQKVDFPLVDSSLTRNRYTWMWGRGPRIQNKTRDNGNSYGHSEARPECGLTLVLLTISPGTVPLWVVMFLVSDLLEHRLSPGFDFHLFVSRDKETVCIRCGVHVQAWRDLDRSTLWVSV